MNTLIILKIPASLFLLTLVSGVGLRMLGKSLNGILFNIHKLIALGAVFLAAREIYQRFSVLETNITVMALIILVGLCVIALFSTGALMSMEKTAYETYQLIHRVAVGLLTIAAIASFYFLTGFVL